MEVGDRNICISMLIRDGGLDPSGQYCSHLYIIAYTMYPKNPNMNRNFGIH